MRVIIYTIFLFSKFNILFATTIRRSKYNFCDFFSSRINRFYSIFLVFLLTVSIL